tara:strand:- start:477 stop:1136 length:660 start_codon:yes stop_codon:yes gene_type:complete
MNSNISAEPGNNKFLKFLKSGLYPEWESSVPQWDRYALFAPILNRILFLSFGKDTAIKLSLLTSSRIATVPVRITECDNFKNIPESSKDALIDNDCCFLWTLEDSSEITQFTPYCKLSDNSIVSYNKKLMPSQYEPDPDLIMIRNFMFLGYWALKKFEQNASLDLLYSQNLIPVIPNGIIERYYSLKKMCMEEIYLSTDFDDSVVKVENYISQYLEEFN